MNARVRDGRTRRNCEFDRSYRNRRGGRNGRRRGRETRLGRSTRDVLNLVHELEQKGASLRVLEPAIDTAGLMGRMVLTVLGMVAEMELGFICVSACKIDPLRD